ncbi:MAG: universal stress protein [Polyangiaceae bacterium]|nr:universal stress protein [Polyangiaceae bacterium]
MKQIESILVATDFSECSQLALRAACELGSKLGATVDVVHVWEMPAFVAPDLVVASAGTDTETLLAHTRARADLAIGNLLKEAEGAGLKLHHGRAEQGDPSETVVRLAEEGGYGLVVVGTHGRTGLARLFLGSVAEKIVRASRTPVLIIRAEGGG